MEVSPITTRHCIVSTIEIIEESDISGNRNLLLHKSNENTGKNFEMNSSKLLKLVEVFQQFRK
jgi:hypothetical protein